MAKKYLDDNGLLYLWGKIKAAFVGDINYDSSTGYVTKTKNGSTSNVVAIPTGVSPSSTTPAMDGTAAVGTETAFARGDHVHPTDTSRAAASHTHFAADVKIAVPVGQQAQTVQSWITSAETDMETIWETLDDKVDSEAGKGLSTNDFTDTLKNKLDGIESGAEVNVQSNWTQTDTTADDYIKNKPSSMTPSSHTHGNITNAGALQTTDIAIANGDKLVVTDASNSNKVARTSVTFDGSTATQALTKKGTWETFNNYTHPTYTAQSASAVKVGNDGTGHVVIGSALTASDVGAVDSSAVGQADGICPLDSNGLVDSSYLPSFVDDVIEAYARTGQTAGSAAWLGPSADSARPYTPETGKIYVLMADSGDFTANTQFRWGGTTYVKLNDGGVSSITNAEIDTIVAS